MKAYFQIVWLIYIWLVISICHLLISCNLFHFVCVCHTNIITDELDNKIEDVYGFTETTCPWLTVLELKGNNVKTLVGLDLPQLQRLYLVKNSFQKQMPGT